MRVLSALSSALVLTFLAGCITSTVVPTTAHDPVNPSTVLIYQRPPSKYENLGLVTVTKDVKYGAGYSADHIIVDLLDQAAKKGANGLLLVQPPNSGNGNLVDVGGSYKGQWYHVTVNATDKDHPIVEATAIWMVDK